MAVEDTDDETIVWFEGYPPVATHEELGIDAPASAQRTAHRDCIYDHPERTQAAHWATTFFTTTAFRLAANDG